MKLTIVSDLHVDVCVTQQSKFIPFKGGDVIVVAGDTANCAKEAANTLNYLATLYSHVVFVDGNHEHYSNSYHDKKKDTIENNNAYLDSMISSNVTRLNSKQYFDYEGFRFIGNCGWYTFDYYSPVLDRSLDLWKTYSNDWNCIYTRGSNKQLLPHSLAKYQSQDMLKQIRETPEDKKVIVVTHTVPHKKLLHHNPHDKLWEEMSSFYYNSHNEKILTEEQIFMWINGHTHLGKDMVISNTRCISNPKGYPNENRSWTPMDLEL